MTKFESLLSLSTLLIGLVTVCLMIGSVRSMDSSQSITRSIASIQLASK